MGTHRRRVCHEANSSRLSLSLSLLCSSSLVPRCRRSFPASAFFPSLDTRHTCQHSLNTRATCLSLNGPRNLYFAEAYARLVKRGLLTRRNRLPAVFHSPLPLSASFFLLLFFLLPLPSCHLDDPTRSQQTIPRIFLLESIEEILENFRGNQEIVGGTIGSFQTNRSFLTFVHH